MQDDHVAVVLGGIFSSTRQAINDPAVVEGETLYIYPEQYEGQEYHPLLFCTGAVPAQQVEPLIPWVMQQTGARTFYLPSADYIWPHVMNRKVHEVASANGGEIVGEEYFPVDHADWGETVDRISSSGADIVFNTTVPPGCFPFLEALCESGFTNRGGRIITTYWDENLVSAVPPEHMEGLYGCIDYYQSVNDRFSQELLGRTLPAPRPNCCATRARAVCARRRSRPSSPRPATAWRNDRASCRRASRTASTRSCSRSPPERPTRRSPRPSASPPRLRATTSSTSSTRRACEPGVPRPSGRSSTTWCSPRRASSSPSA